ncbi:MAG TPA: tRNA (guanosine(37)-N1)-methyltransferase TrmD [Kofleriaceae bacterium]
MKFSVVTILPELVEPSFAAGVVGRAREAGLITVATINPRDFTTDRHRTVDDTPYGGGAGMVMKSEPLLAAIAKAGEGAPEKATPHRIFLGPAGAPLTQARVKELALLDHIVLVCGRYEGVDERVLETGIDEVLSIGDYVLSGGELAALVVIDACARLVPGVLGEPTSADDESHSAGLLEYPQYTRPPVLKDGERELPVPAVLSSGNHAAINTWRRQQSLARTAQRRPDMFARYAPSAEDRKLFPPALAHRTHLALVHHPVFDRTGKVVTSSLTNFDIHDLARSSMTYDLAAYHIVTPVTVQREKAEHIANLWLEDAEALAQREALAPKRKPPKTGSRGSALARIRTADSVETAIANITAQHGTAPVVVGTSARIESFPSAARRSPDQLLAEMVFDSRPLLILLGTGWGLADHLIPSVTQVLTPIEGGSNWNHLSVRSAGAILLDRLFDKQVGRPA